MTFRLYNTLTRTKEDFVPLDPKNVRMYVCGPTVYDFAHIGNARPVIVFDVLFRLLRHLYGEKHVTYVRNVTDIDDKINARAAERGISIRDLTDETYQYFHDDVAALGCLPPTYEPRATNHIEEMKEIIELLISSQNAYVEQEHVLFNVSSMPDYGKLSRKPLDELIAGARVDVAPFKRNSMDFVLWKPSYSHGKNYPLPGWSSPGGIETIGRPGWHIECSAMAWKYLKEQFDIHGGGIDLIFPHHENEIAQSRCAFHAPFLAKYWMHNGFLNVEGEKMSKSLGNFVTIRELVDEFPNGAIRLAMLRTHYRQPINWTRSEVDDASELLREWALVILVAGGIEEIRTAKLLGQATPHQSVLDALKDDLNTPKAISALHELYEKRDQPGMLRSFYFSCEFLGLLSDTTIGAHLTSVSSKGLGPQLSAELFETQKQLGISVINGLREKQAAIEAKLREKDIFANIANDGYIRFEQVGRSTDDEILQAIAARNAARKAKNFKEADRIRDELDAKGIVLMDSPSGTTWEVKR